MRTFPKLVGDNGAISRIRKLVNEYPFLLGDMKKENAREQKEEQTIKAEIEAINGIKSYFYYNVVVLVSNYYQMDLIKKNRWKDMESVSS